MLNRYATKAIDILRTWFIANETKMEPNMEYAGMIFTGDLLPKFQGKGGQKYIKRLARGQSTGIMEGRPFYYLLGKHRAHSANHTSFERLRYAGGFHT